MGLRSVRAAQAALTDGGRVGAGLEEDQDEQERRGAEACGRVRETLCRAGGQTHFVQTAGCLGGVTGRAPRGRSSLAAGMAVSVDTVAGFDS